MSRWDSALVCWVCELVLWVCELVLCAMVCEVREPMNWEIIPKIVKYGLSGEEICVRVIVSKSGYRQRKEITVSRGKRIFGIVMICVSLLALFSWEKFGRFHFIYKDVLVLNQDVERGEAIKPEMLKTIKMEGVQRDMLKVSDRKWILKQASGQYIHRNAPLYRQYFTEERLLTSGRGRFHMQLPEKWVLSCPRDLRRGDRVLLEGGDDCSVKATVADFEGETKCLEVVLGQQDARRIGKAAERSGVVVFKY